MKAHRFSLGLLALLGAWMTGGVADADARDKPNIVLFLVDDMGWMDCTPYGSRYYQTPNMERLAARAMRFTDAYASPICSPTRASLLTGKYSARHGITTPSGHLPPKPPGFQYLPDSAPPDRKLVTPASKNYLEPSEYTLAEALRDAGWRTAHIGKWHLGLTEPYWPEQQGFEFALHAGPDPGPPSYFSPYKFRDFQTYKNGPPGEYITDRLTDEAIRYIEANRDAPFYLNLWHHGVHGPWGHKEEITRMFVGKKDPRGKQGNPIMASMLKSVDESLGRILDKLDELKLTDDTIFIFFGDNGGNTHSNTPDDVKNAGAGGARAAIIKDWRKWAGDSPPTNNAPLRDGKGTLYEGGVRVPLMIAQPGVVEPGTTTGVIADAIDLYPTILDMLHLKPNPEQKMDGISLVPALKQTGPLARDGTFGYQPHGRPEKPPAVTARVGDWKLIRWFETGPNTPELHELYNLRDDLGETRNLAASRPEKVRELNARIDRFLKETGALYPRPNPAYKPDAAADRGRPARSLGDWVPKHARVTEGEDALIVEADGKNPFLVLAKLKCEGPVTLRMRARSGGGACKVQWRISDQETFPASGQAVEFQLPGGNAWGEARVVLPARGTLEQMRLYLPAQDSPVEIAWIELEPARGPARRWEFGSK